MIVTVVAILHLSSLACAAAATPTPVPAPTASPVPKVQVVATTTVLADLARNVGGNLVEVNSLVPPGADVHSFQTTPSDSIAIGQANVIVSNGFGLDSFLDPVLTNNMRAKAVQVVAAEGLITEPLEEMPFPGEAEGEGHTEEALVDEVEQLIHRAEAGEISAEEAIATIEELVGGHQEEPDDHAHEGHDEGEESLEEGLMGIIHEAEEGHMSPESALESMDAMVEEHAGGGHAHEHASGDPHFWQDPVLAIHYVERIRDGLVRADPDNAQAYSSNAETYIQELRDLDQEIAQTLSQVPPEHRHLVSFHDAFGYFGRRYGWQVSFFEPTDASDVTPRAVESIISQIKSEGIPAIFAEPQFAPDVLEQAAKDTGIKVGVIHSLPDSTAPTYVEMMRSNARSLAENLR